MVDSIRALLGGAAVALMAGSANAETLRLLTWGSYAPDELVQKFEKEYPDIDVEVTFSNKAVRAAVRGRSTRRRASAPHRRRRVHVAVQRGHAPAEAATLVAHPGEAQGDGKLGALGVCGSRRPGD